MKKRYIICVCAVILACSLLLAGCGTAKNESAGEGWKPTASVNLIVPYAAGGGTDLLVRAIAQYIDLDGQTMYITNIEGGSGVIGCMEAYHADNDGLTLLSQAVETAAAAYADGSSPENICEDMVWIASLAEDPCVVSVVASSPYESLEDVIAAAKTSSSGMTLAGSGSTFQNIAALQIRQEAGVELTFVPYDSGAKARAAVLGGHEDLLLGQLSEAKPYADSGELRILAVALEERSEVAPDIPTFKELGYDLTCNAHRGIILPPETDEKIARYYEGKLKEVFENEEFQSLMCDTLGYTPSYTGMDDLKDTINASIEWAEKYVQLMAK